MCHRRVRREGRSVLVSDCYRTRTGGSKKRGLIGLESTNDEFILPKHRALKKKGRKATTTTPRRQNEENHTAVFSCFYSFPFPSYFFLLFVDRRCAGATASSSIQSMSPSLSRIPQSVLSLLASLSPERQTKIPLAPPKAGQSSSHVFWNSLLAFLGYSFIVVGGGCCYCCCSRSCSCCTRKGCCQFGGLTSWCGIIYSLSLSLSLLSNPLFSLAQ